jgi:hypothetical protein
VKAIAVQAVFNAKKHDFLYGSCLHFAMVLNKFTGWPIFVEVFKDGYIDNIWHAWCVNPAGKAVDVNGIHRGRKPKYDKFPNDRSRVREATQADLIRHAYGSPRDTRQRTKARLLIEQYPEIFGVTQRQITQHKNAKPNLRIRSITSALARLDDGNDHFSIQHLAKNSRSMDAVRPLIVIVHPGDAIQDPAGYSHGYAEVKAYSFACQQGMADDLRAWLKDDTDIVILHRTSCAQLSKRGDWINENYRSAIKEARLRALILFGDDIPEVVKTLQTRAFASQRHDIRLIGAYNDPETGCVSGIGQRLEVFCPSGSIRISEYCVTGNGPGNPAWIPKSTLN